MFWNAFSPKEKQVDDLRPWPSVNGRLWVRLPCCEHSVHPSHVRSHDVDTMVIAAPSKPHGPAPAPADDALFTMGWTAEGTNVRVGAEFVKLVEESGLWEVRPRGEFERRELTRVEVGGRVLLYFSKGAAPVAGEIADLGEGGIGCFIPLGVAAPTGGALEVSFDDTEGNTMLLGAEIAWWGSEIAGTRRVGLKFKHNDERTAARLRSTIHHLRLTAH